MPIYSFKPVKSSAKAAHQTVEINDKPAGDVWREQTSVPNAKGIHTKKWRWFAQIPGESRVEGRGTRVAVLFGGGFKSKDIAAEKLYVGRESSFD